MKLRPCQPEDVPRIMDIGQRAWAPIRAMQKKELGDALYAHLNPNPETEKGRQIAEHAQNYPQWTWVCEREGPLLGFITFFIDRDKRVGEILNNAVDPELGLKGVGQFMYRGVLNYFREKELFCAKVQTGLDEAHAPARRAYERAGFTQQLHDVTYFCEL
ncbi:GNAT family N-acetyltransferase [Kiritimatiellaeota bacterium B1221]|nr:GNAT family N-acetyltransferase [Kiritimatiellaeota bacterium B1221]